MRLGRCRLDLAQLRVAENWVLNWGWVPSTAEKRSTQRRVLDPYLGQNVLPVPGG